RAGARVHSLARSVRALPAPRHRSAARDARQSSARRDQSSRREGGDAMKRIGALLAGLVVVLIVLALMTFPANQNADFPGYMEADLVLSALSRAVAWPR